MARNQYKGLCYQCGLIVAPGTGHFEKHGHGWRVKHANVPGDGRMTCEQAAEDDEEQKGLDGYPLSRSNPFGERV